MPAAIQRTANGGEPLRVQRFGMEIGIRESYWGRNEQRKLF